jgi:hypothetical protein
MRNWACERWRDESQIKHNERLEQMRSYSCKKRKNEFQEAHHQRDVITSFLQSLDVKHLIVSFYSTHVCQIYNIINSSLKVGMDESIGTVCYNLVLTSTLQLYYLYELLLELMRKRLHPSPNLPILRIKLAMTTLAQSSVWLSLVKAGRNHILCSHSYVFATTLDPLALFFPTNIAALQNFKVAIVGAYTSMQFLHAVEKSRGMHSLGGFGTYLGYKIG